MRDLGEDHSGLLPRGESGSCTGVRVIQAQWGASRRARVSPRAARLRRERSGGPAAAGSDARRKKGRRKRGADGWDRTGQTQSGGGKGGLGRPGLGWAGVLGLGPIGFSFLSYSFPFHFETPLKLFEFKSNLNSTPMHSTK